MDNTTDFVSKLLSKSQEAFLLAIEIYNKPSIRYRVEGFSFFICNAWELMLKARLIKTRGESSIVKAKLFCPEIAGLFCRIAGLFCHDSRANLSLKPVCFGIAIS